MSTPSMEQISRAAVDSGYWEHDEVARALAAHDAEVRADERAKRPDREQIARALFEADGRRNYDGSPTPWHILDLDEQAHYRKLADAVLSSLALEPEAREEPSKGQIHAGAAAIYKLRHPTFTYMIGVDTWAYDYAKAALRAAAAVTDG